jgi:cytochrome c biogenesis protein CcmG/thiol:disulfide interchange protein DsbE
MKGQVWLLNVWASWCVSCREEHPLLLALGKANIVPIIGSTTRTRPPPGKRWLSENGDPYTASGRRSRRQGRHRLGVYGVPGNVRHRQGGNDPLQADRPLTAEALEKKIVPLIRELQNHEPRSARACPSALR